MHNNSFFINMEVLRDIGNIGEVILFLRMIDLTSQSEDGCAYIGTPQREELCGELNVTSFASVNRMLRNLIDKGYLVHLKRGTYKIPEDKRLCAMTNEDIPF